MLTWCREGGGGRRVSMSHQLPGLCCAFFDLCWNTFFYTEHTLIYMHTHTHIYPNIYYIRQNEEQSMVMGQRQ